jgi:hypothetical protein
MHMSRRAGLALLAIGALAGSAATAITASGDDSAPTVLKVGVLPSDPGGAAIYGVNPGAVPWTLAQGNLKLTGFGDGNGELTIRLKGLLITGTGGPLDGTTGPVTTVTASLVCAPGAAAFMTTAPVALTRKGNAAIDVDIPLPGGCGAPAVLINPNGQTATYIAVDGFHG